MGPTLARASLIENPDRTEDNPNLLFDGSHLAIFDHELALNIASLLFWRPPWEDGAINYKAGHGSQRNHVFLKQLLGSTVSLRRLAGAIEAVTPAKLQAYRNSLPPEWLEDASVVDDALAYLANLIEHIHQATQNVSEALT